MSTEVDELEIMTVNARQRNKKRIRMSVLIAALIAVLAFKTQWPTLQPGLFILLAGQLALAAFLVVRNRRLQEQSAADPWLDQEIFATRTAAWLENAPRILGFVVLAVGFWRSTGNLAVSLALGLVYPALLLWQLARVYSRQTSQRFAAQRERLHALSQKSTAAFSSPSERSL